MVRQLSALEEAKRKPGLELASTVIHRFMAAIMERMWQALQLAGARVFLALPKMPILLPFRFFQNLLTLIVQTAVIPAPHVPLAILLTKFLVLNAFIH